MSIVNGAHVILYSQDADADRAFFRDVLGFPAVDAGHGWLIFALPPAEAAFHPAPPGPEGAAEDRGASFYLMCDDLEATVRTLQARGVTCTPSVRERWGLLTSIVLPGGGRLGLYQPHHPTALALGRP
jgi:catechol 2,3-dioxygenase-like lactoylglutathione lyase family enzyme